MALKFYTCVEKGLKLKVRKFGGLILTFVEVIGGKLVGRSFCLPALLNRVNTHSNWVKINSQTLSKESSSQNISIKSKNNDMK